MTARTFIDAGEVAGLLEMTRGQFARRKAQLLEEAGFPRPVPWARAPQRWRRADVEAWVAGIYVAPDTGVRERASAARKAVMHHMAKAS